MTINGKCDFCKTSGEWEAGLFESKNQARSRPTGWAAIFPWNCARLPKGCTFAAESLRRFGIITHFACPKCYRDVRSNDEKAKTIN